MREIKFRMWDKKDKVMIYPNEYGNAEAGYEQRDSLYLDFNGNVVWHNYGDMVGSDDRFELMQYTGLKDKNGVEIYEGDFIKAKDITEPYLIGFEELEFTIQTKFGGTIRKTQDAIDWFEFEVIGNIHDKGE